MSEHSVHNPTTNPSCHGEDVVTGTNANSGLNRKDTQSTTSPLPLHVASNSGTHPMSNGTIHNDVTMEQIDNTIVADGLVLLDPKRKRADAFGPTLEPTSNLFDLNGPEVSKSDHMPLHLQILPPDIPNPRAGFRFENLWLREAHCR
nr:uncharacterized protein LOC109173053 [Ipomoea batatas]